MEDGAMMGCRREQWPVGITSIGGDDDPDGWHHVAEVEFYRLGLAAPPSNQFLLHFVPLALLNSSSASSAAPNERQQLGVGGLEGCGYGQA